MKKLNIAGLAVLAAVFLFGCMTPNRMEYSPRTISVTGEGVVSARPDAAQFTVGYSERKESTTEAQRAVAEKMNMVLQIVQDWNIPNDHVSLLQLRISPEYGWRNGERYLLGQRVSQSLHIEIRDISDDARELAGILDELGMIQGIEISSVTFSVHDPRELYNSAREIALTHAAGKAEQLAAVSGMTLLKPLSISEDLRETPVVQEFFLAEARDAQTVVPPGRVEFTSRVSVKFEMEQ